MVINMKQKITLAKKKIYEKIIEEATIDCYNEYEDLCGWECILDEKIVTPCPCKIGKQDATLEKIGSNGNVGTVVGVIRLNKAKIRVLLQDIMIENSETMKYINAYKYWCKNG